MSDIVSARIFCVVTASYRTATSDYIYISDDGSVWSGDVTAAPWFTDFTANPGKVSLTFGTGVTGDRVMFIAKSLRQGSVSGVVGAEVRIADISEYINKFDLAPNGYGLLLDKDLRVVAHAQLRDNSEKADKYFLAPMESV